MNYRLALATATLFAGLTASAALAFTGHPSLKPGAMGGSPVDPAAPCKFIALSDKSGGVDPLYSSAPPYASYVPMPTLSSANGWGLYLTHYIMYAGVAPNSINVYKPCELQYVGYTYTTFGFGPPLSIAADTSGNMYATEDGSSTIDWFASGDTATTDTARGAGLPYYLAVDNAGNVYVSGWDNTNSVEQIDECGPGMTACHTCETIPAPSWPGGVALDGNQHLIVNNEIGSIYVFNAGCGSQTSSYVYSATSSPQHFHFTAVTLSTNEAFIWGAKQFDLPAAGCGTPFCLDAQAERYNPITGVVGTIAPARHTPIIPGAQPGGGIAVYPPGPV
jgi:hypothetical protein